MLEKKISATEPTGFGELRCGAFCFSSEGISGSEAAATRRGVARFFEPDDRLVGVRLQEMHGSNQVIERPNDRITRAEANGLLHQQDHLVCGNAGLA